MCDAAGAGPKSIPEDVPPEKPVDLHTVGTLSFTSEPVAENLFFSLRFGAKHGVVPMAKQLQLLKHCLAWICVVYSSRLLRHLPI